MRRFPDPASRPGEPDAVLTATRALAAAVAPGGARAGYAEALRDFRFAVRRRFYVEVTLGLPPDVVGHVMRRAIRLALEAAPPAAARHVTAVAAATLAGAERGLVDDVLG